MGGLPALRQYPLVACSVLLWKSCLSSSASLVQWLSTHRVKWLCVNNENWMSYQCSKWCVILGCLQTFEIILNNTLSCHFKQWLCLLWLWFRHLKTRKVWMWVPICLWVTWTRYVWVWPFYLSSMLGWSCISCFWSQFVL
jgi:hypothetical protein